MKWLALLLIAQSSIAGTLGVTCTVIGPPPQPKVIEQIVTIDGQPVLIRTLVY